MFLTVPQVEWQRTEAYEVEKAAVQKRFQDVADVIIHNLRSEFSNIKAAG